MVSLLADACTDASDWQVPNGVEKRVQVIRCAFDSLGRDLAALASGDFVCFDCFAYCPSALAERFGFGNEPVGFGVEFGCALMEVFFREFVERALLVLFGFCPARKALSVFVAWARISARHSDDNSPALSAGSGAARSPLVLLSRCRIPLSVGSCGAARPLPPKRPSPRVDLRRSGRYRRWRQAPVTVGGSSGRQTRCPGVGRGIAQSRGRSRARRAPVSRSAVRTGSVCPDSSSAIARPRWWVTTSLTRFGPEPFARRCGTGMLVLSQVPLVAAGRAILVSALQWLRFCLL